MLAAMEIPEIPARLRSMKRSQSDLARHLGIDPSSLTKTLKGERRLKADELIKIEQFFGEKVDREATVEALSSRRSTAPRRIPVYGYAAAGGQERVAINAGQVIDWVDAPPLWNGLGDLIVVRIIGDSMEPRYFAGEAVVVHIGLPPGRGQDCLIEFNDGSGVIKNYRGQRDGQVFTWQYNPPKGQENELRFDGASVKAIHAVDLPTRRLR
ncbi:helix-turn-helix domain-containing protein [Caulobacter sp. UNC279MFTsu5.1]|uniref:helix-turn-helix domain-containing protein n=1 Tax=Caulobacter sp. UNC279MFTsu5.1 TaxID=1502775 RepID=UPI00037643A5|nr:helix-turn-helix domain-containing protein [Caulobacter sp. UNC279MFTsu5.1]SFK42082.1 Phage repressor protein C, contains Cro/C1-type HTH and peptisase s24 domains [Caulobacter sp. UNC279MFTsu5.1]